MIMYEVHVSGIDLMSFDRGKLVKKLFLIEGKTVKDKDNKFTSVDDIIKLSKKSLKFVEVEKVLKKDLTVFLTDSTECSLFDVAVKCKTKVLRIIMQEETMEKAVKRIFSLFDCVDSFTISKSKYSDLILKNYESK